MMGGERERIVPLARGFRMDRVQRCATFHALSKTHMQVHARGARQWRAGQLGHLRDAAIVHGHAFSGVLRNDRARERGDLRFAETALRLADGNKLGPGLPAVQRLLRKRIACIGAGFSAHLQKVPGEQQRPLAEIRRGRRVPLQDGEDIPRLESGTDASTDSSPGSVAVVVPKTVAAVGRPGVVDQYARKADVYCWLVKM